MKLAILGGGGAMGGMFGALLSEGGHEVSLIDVAQGAVDAINADGLTIRDKASDTERTVRVRATTQAREIGVVDVVLNFVKCYHTEAAVTSAEPMIGPETAVLTLQNGWGNAPRIAQIVGDERVLVGLTYHSATLLEAGKVLHAGKGMTFLGELNGALSPRLEAISEAFKASGLEVTVTPTVRDEIYKKLALNCCTLPTAALLGFEAQMLVAHAGTLELMRGLLREVVAVAHAQGIALDYDERWEAITTLLKKAVGAKASMLQDVEHRRRTEIEVINGAISSAAKAHGIPTPLNDAMVWMVTALEATF